jgi:hypothetical protein
MQISSDAHERYKAWRHRISSQRDAMKEKIAGPASAHKRTPTSLD